MPFAVLNTASNSVHFKDFADAFSTAANSSSNSPLWIAFFWQRQHLSSILQVYPRLWPHGPDSSLEIISHQPYTIHFRRT